MATNKIRRNVYGNLNGYVGTTKVVEFGLDGERALNWLKKRQALEVAQLDVKHAEELRDSESEVKYGPISTMNASN